MDGVTCHRGDLVTVAAQGDFGKPRPALVIQSDYFNPTHPTITVLPLTSELRDTVLFRITIEPSSDNGLRSISQVMVDKPLTCLAEKLGKRIGRLDDRTLLKVSQALAMWLGIV